AAQPGADTAQVPAAAPASASASASTVPGQNTPPPAASEQIQISTDVYDLTFDTQGAQIVKAQLLKYSGLEDPSSPMVLLDNVPGSTYLAQTGVVGSDAGKQFPSHLTPFRMVSSERALSGDELKVVFDAQTGDVK